MTLFIQNNHSILFLHVPKCGGSSVAKLFEDNGYSKTLEMRGLPPQDCLTASPQHQTCANLRSMINTDELGDIFIVTRNPYDRIISEFNWQFRKTLPEERPNINNWIVESLEKASINSEYADNHFRACVDFIDENLHCSIFRLEDGIQFVAEYFLRKNSSIHNIEIPVEKSANQFIGSSKKPNLNTFTIQAINQFYKYDFEAFGYELLDRTDYAYTNNEKPLKYQEEGKENETKNKLTIIRKWREDTISKLYQKVQKELSLINEQLEHADNMNNKAYLQKGKEEADKIYDNILFKIHHGEQQIKKLASSKHDTETNNMPETKRLTSQYQSLLQKVKVNNISNTIQLIDQHRSLINKRI